MKRFLVFLTLTTLLLLSLSLSVIAQDQPGPDPVGLRPDAPTYALHGPYWVGTREFVIEDDERPLPMTIWYPALNPEKLQEAVEYDAGVADFMPGPLNIFPGHALADALPDLDHGPYPLVIFSHGGGASRYFSAYYPEHLASYGFVTISVEHVGSAIRESITVPQDVLNEINLPEGTALRLLDVKKALAYTEGLNAAGGALENLIDMDRIAVSGWSFGGTAALMTAGARFDFDALAKWCASTDPQTSPGSENSCNLLKNKERIAELLGLEQVPEGLWQSVGDDRIDAIILMAPGRGPTFGVEGLANIKIPLLTLLGTMDAVDGAQDNGYFVYHNVASDQKALVAFKNGGHMIFGNCSPAWRMGGFPFCFDSVWDMDRAHDLVNHFTTAFLLDVLKGDQDAHAALATDTVSFPGIEYESQGS